MHHLPDCGWKGQITSSAASSKSHVAVLAPPTIKMLFSPEETSHVIKRYCSAEGKRVIKGAIAEMCSGT